jgi:acetyl-CoA carboxylase carboxyl transferase subunit alpha
MMENSWYSVISPENCSSILWRSWEQKEIAAEALKLTASDATKLKVVDGIIAEPLGGAHVDRESAFLAVRDAISNSYDKLKNLSPKELVKQRMDKYSKIGVFKG